MSDVFKQIVSRLASAGTRLNAEDYRDGDIVFFFEEIPAETPGGDVKIGKAGFCILTDAKHRVALNPYKDKAEPARTPLGENTYVIHFRSINWPAKEINRNELYSLLWAAYETASRKLPSEIVVDDARNVPNGDLVLTERLDGTLLLHQKGEYEDYPEPPRPRRHWYKLWRAPKLQLVERIPFHQYRFRVSSLGL